MRAASIVNHALTEAEIGNKRTPFEFEHQGTRELTAHDLRLRHPPARDDAHQVAVIFTAGGENHGAEGIRRADQQRSMKKLRNGRPLTDRSLPFLDFRDHSFAGAEALDDHTLRIRLIGKYPQFKYWMTTAVSSHPCRGKPTSSIRSREWPRNNLTMNDWPVGTGPYMLTESQVNRRHVLTRNPNFRGEPYPCEGEER